MLKINIFAQNTRRLEIANVLIIKATRIVALKYGIVLVLWLSIWAGVHRCLAKLMLNCFAHENRLSASFSTI